MKYNMRNRDELSRGERRKRLAGHLIYIALMLFFYVIMRAGIFGAWQPVLIIPLATAAAMYRDELSACLFALLCGYMIDIACGYVFGFSAVWLMTVCVGAALLVRNLIRVNIVNFLIITAAAILLEFSMDYLFNVLIWNIPRGDVILTASVIPTAAATAVASPFVYLLVSSVERRLAGTDIDIVYYDADKQTDEQEDKA
ncbi:MAG: hypothetical protein K5876_00030 [Ruminiclostridium sp.]|nr:hypothetical protein [Ruminiclostridium sp.]